MAAKFPVTGFADEISGDLNTQVETLARLRLDGLDLRSVNGVNVLDLSDDELRQVRDRCSEHGLAVQSIGSPVNKVSFTPELRGPEFEKLKKSIHAAKTIGITKIRIFTPEVSEGDHEAATEGVIEWMREQRALAGDQGVVLIHENDAKFWGAYPANAKLLFDELASPNFRAVFDFANTTLLGFDAMDDWFPWLLPYLDTLHIKDALKAEHKVVPAGKGDGRIAETLSFLIDKGWSGPLTLEPHLQSAGAFGGYSGSQLFEVAVTSFREILEGLKDAMQGGE